MMVFNCPKAVTQYRNQHKSSYYEATVMILGRETTADKQKIKTFVKISEKCK